MLNQSIVFLIKYAEMKQTLGEKPYVTAPPPMGYPVMVSDSPQTVQYQTQNKGSGGFLRGW